MGFRTTWVAVKHAPLEKVVAETKLRDTGDTVSLLDVGLYGFELSEWAVVVGAGSAAYMKLDARPARALSAKGEALFFQQSDTSMTATLLCYRDQQLLWSVRYEGFNGISDPIIEGEPPAALAAILDRRNACQARAGGASARVDYLYEIPTDLGLALTGFRHDQDPESATLRVLAEA